MSSSPVFDIARSGDSNALLAHIQKDREAINKQDMVDIFYHIRYLQVTNIVYVK
jgi:hypothetical protein